MPKALGEKSGALERGHWSRFAGTGWKTGTYGRFQPVLKAGFPVVSPNWSDQLVLSCVNFWIGLADFSDHFDWSVC